MTRCKVLLTVLNKNNINCVNVFNFRVLSNRGRLSLASCRHLTSGEVSTALRPFYFSVHPDLFGQYPSERAINENSLQVLSSYLETLQQKKYPLPTTLKFYLRPNGEIKGKDCLKSVNIRLSQKDLKNTVVSILSTCNLPTTYVDKITPPPPPHQPGSVQDKFYNFRRTYREYDFEVDPSVIFHAIRNSKEPNRNNQSLLGWLARNFAGAREKLKACEPVREEVARLREELRRGLGLHKVLWDCGWNITHFRGCLQSFGALASHHSEVMDVLKGRTLVFGNDTGLSLDGHILLYSGEVRHNWLDFIKKVPKEDEVLRTVPAFEKAMSRVLRDIQIVRRKFQPKTMVKQYEDNLRRLTTTLSDYQGRHGYPRQWPSTLDQYELVVETGAGPLMVSPTGQFIVPCSCPSFLLVNFITEHLDKAAQLLNEYKSHKQVEKDLHRLCTTEFGLAALDKDDSVTPRLMIACCRSLLEGDRSTFRRYLVGMRLTITNYYSVMSDGQICIPWNWKELEANL
ncbi:hypothetical protein AAG570_002025 [Ranatra chinensis]|uniref:T-cell activation inhibitor, mitochondrial n=1 Tax=Ranatra chinensis TaxID=642074 RepID=A0ABD0YA71_9HEMI